MARDLQLAFLEFEKEKIKDFGGTTVKGNPRERRPISLGRPMHLVMRSSHARADRSFLKRSRRIAIQALVERQARLKGVRIYRYANSGNHLHLIVLPRSRESFHAFTRAISGLIARLVLRAERGCAKNLRFWDARPFTRILEWGRDYRRACAYVVQNKLEALGFVPYRPRQLKKKAPP
ncbi:MAG: transposase [Bdellovibrionales bacterium]|nr:transposase [Bdellovibrionales bacterium]